jgi:hypothetical protein
VIKKNLIITDKFNISSKTPIKKIKNNRIIRFVPEIFRKIDKFIVIKIKKNKPPILIFLYAIRLNFLVIKNKRSIKKLLIK